jgi:carboxymethylenebutenolidase
MTTDKPFSKAGDFPPEVLKLFDEYVHNVIDRRAFLDGAAKFAVGGLTAAGFLEALSPRYAEAQQVSPNDRRVKGEKIEFSSPHGYGKASGYLVHPAPAARNAGVLPTILVAHENRGLNPHIEDIARRLALDGFMALAPDALTPLGGYPGSEEKAVAQFSQLDQAKTRQDFLAAAQWLRTRPDGNGKMGVTGFCYGGGQVLRLAVALPDLNAAVPF